MIPGDRVRVTAGDWCGETGTVGGVDEGGYMVALDTGGHVWQATERLEAA